jgi:2-hydroxychromene-2-carboxylate isomerase
MSIDDEEQTPPETEPSKTIEQWGEEKGMWPVINAKTGRGNRNAWKYQQAKTHAQWADGQSVTEAEFDRAVAEATSQVQR